MVARCIRCFEEYPGARKALGFSTCLSCGERDAKIEAQRKAKCVAPLYNKGAYQYIATVDQAKDVGR